MKRGENMIEKGRNIHMRRDKDGKTIRNDALAPYQSIPHPSGVNIEIGENRGADTRSSLVEMFLLMHHTQREVRLRGEREVVILPVLAGEGGLRDLMVFVLFPLKCR
jgi:hypothetical protein